MDKKKIPLKKLVINDMGHGVNKFALVDEPAIMTDFITFKKEHAVKYAVQDANRRIIMSPVLIPYQQIPRIDKETGEPYLVYMDEETVFKAALKWAAEGRQTLANEMHDDAKPVNGIVWYGTVVTDECMFSNPKGFEDMPMKTWFTMGKVYSDEAWAKIQDGTYKGISMEGFFDMVDDDALTDTEVEHLRQIFS